jgi:hypothetical protein
MRLPRFVEGSYGIFADSLTHIEWSRIKCLSHSTKSSANIPVTSRPLSSSELRLDLLRNIDG